MGSVRLRGSAGARDVLNDKGDEEEEQCKEQEEGGFDEIGTGLACGVGIVGVGEV